MNNKILISIILTASLLPAICWAAPPAIPQLAAWETHMLSCSATIISAQPTTANHSTCAAPGCDILNEALLWYYDGNRVFHQISAYTSNTAWLTIAAKCRGYYRDYLTCPVVNHYVDGWRNFTKGLYFDWINLGDATSKNDAILMAKRGKFSQIVHASDYHQWDNNVDVSREIAYAINAWHVARDLGDPAFSGRDPYLDIAYNQLDLWATYLAGYPGSTYPSAETGKYQPFMFGLTAEALITVYERTDTNQADKNKILQKLKDVALLTYNKLYNDAWHSFPQNTGVSNSAAPSLNLLVVPPYGWLWHETGDNQFLTMGDKVFGDGVVYGWPEVWGGKQFSQNYRWSFDYVRWRSTDPVISPTAPGSPDELSRVKTYPNPVKRSSGAVSKINGLTGNCTVEIYDGSGNKIRDLKEALQALPNSGYVEWDGNNSAGNLVGKGIYMYVVRSPAGNKKTGKIAILK
ncbi:MAG: hypothetical protein WCI43_02415 [Candidatus Firestonebacteria bacterium]